MKKINFFTTTNIFIEDNLNEFTLEEVIRHIKENGIYRPMPTSLQSLDEAVRIFKPSSK